MPQQLPQGKDQSLRLFPLQKSSQHLFFSDMIIFYYDTVAINVMIKYSIVAGIFIV